MLFTGYFLRKTIDQILAIPNPTIFLFRFQYWTLLGYLGDIKARLHRRFLSRQLDAIFVAPKLHQVSNMFETPAISRRKIAIKIAPGLQVRFWSCNLSATKIASSCCDKSRLCKRAFRLWHIPFHVRHSSSCFPSTANIFFSSDILYYFKVTLSCLM